MTDVTARWAGAADAASGSTYQIDYTLNGVTWVEAEAAQAATAPYTPVLGALNGNASFGANQIILVDGGSFGTTGYAYLDDALIQWTGKSTNTLTGVTWHSGYGTYASGSTVMVAHESCEVTGITVSLGAVLWRIKHTNPAGAVSQAAYLWYFHPPVAPADCCVVITRIQTDLGFQVRSGVDVEVYIATDRDFGLFGGGHVDSGTSSARTQITNALGLTFHECVKSIHRETVGGGASAPYTFILDSGEEGKLTVTVATIPDQPWVLLSQIATGAS